MATLSELRARVRRYIIDVPDDTDTELDNWINEALIHAQDQHNFRFQRAEMSEETASGTRKLADKPADWKEARSDPWLHTGTGEAELIKWAVSQEQMRGLYSQDDSDDTGQPTFVLETPTEFEVYPFPDDNSLWGNGNYRIIIPYWKYLDELSADGDSNEITNDRTGERFVVFGAVAEAFLFNLDEERGRIWMQRAAQELQRLVSRDKRSYLHRDVTLVPHAGVYGQRGGRHHRPRRHRRFWY